MMISSSVSKEYLEPSVAALVHGDLNLPANCSNFDLSNACLGFMSSMKLAAQLIQSDQIKYALLVASESSRNVVTQTIKRLQKNDATMEDYKSFLPTLTLGSGAVAMLLTHESISQSPHRLTAYKEAAHTQFNRICVGTHDWMRTDAQTLLKEGVSLAKDVWGKCQKELGWQDHNIDYYTVHQVGATHLATIGQALKIDINKAIRSYPHFGNMGSAAVPFTLKLGADEGKYKEGDKIALMGIGSGLNCAMAEVIW